MTIYRTDTNESGCDITVESCDKSRGFCVVADSQYVIRRRLKLHEAETLCSALAMCDTKNMDRAARSWRMLEAKHPPERDGVREFATPAARSNYIAFSASQ